MKKENLVKVVILSLLMVSVVTLVGCGEKNINEAGIKNEDKTVEKNEGVLSGIRNMIKNGSVMKCTNKDEDGEWTTYTNGKYFKGEGIRAGKKQQVLFVDETTYIWDNSTKKGQKLNKKCLEEFQKEMGVEGNVVNATEQKEEFSVEKLEAEEKAGRSRCVAVTGINFSIPSDVEFVDQCEVMKQQMQGLKKQMQNFKQINNK